MPNSASRAVPGLDALPVLKHPRVPQRRGVRNDVTRGAPVPTDKPSSWTREPSLLSDKVLHTDAAGNLVGPKPIAVFTAQCVDRTLHATLRSHYADHADLAVVLVVDRISEHDISALAPFGLSAVIRTSELTGSPDLLTTVTATVSQGGYRLPPGLGSIVRTAAAAPGAPPTRPALGQPGVLLRPHEILIVGLTAEGRTRQGSARQLHRSENHVKDAMRSVCKRLGVTTSAAAVAYAAREGLLWDVPAEGQVP